MMVVGPLLMILGGIALMSYGIFIFYAWLPLLYGLVGFEIGILLGNWLIGDVGWVAVLMGIAGAVSLGAASYFLEPLRRILLGVSAGFMLGIAIASLLGLENSIGGIVGFLLAAGFGFVGGTAVPRFFDTFIVAASAVGGAAMIMNGAHFLFPGITLFDRSAEALLPSLLAIVLAVAGITWQLMNITRWLHSLGVKTDPHSGDNRDLTKAD